MIQTIQRDRSPFCCRARREERQCCCADVTGSILQLMFIHLREMSAVFQMSLQKANDGILSGNIRSRGINSISCGNRDMRVNLLHILNWYFALDINRSLLHYDTQMEAPTSMPPP